MDNIIKFPSKEYILKCHKCKSNSFYIILNSENWTDLKGFECAECGNYTEFQPNNLINSDRAIPHFCESCGRIEGVQAHFDDCPNKPPGRLSKR